MICPTNTPAHVALANPGIGAQSNPPCAARVANAGFFGVADSMVRLAMNGPKCWLSMGGIGTTCGENCGIGPSVRQLSVAGDRDVFRKSWGLVLPFASIHIHTFEMQTTWQKLLKTVKPGGRQKKTPGTTVAFVFQGVPPDGEGDPKKIFCEKFFRAQKTEIS